MLRKILKNESASPMSSCVSFVISAPVRVSTLADGSKILSMSFARAASVRVPSPTTKMASTNPGLPKNSAAVGTSKSANVAPPGDRTSPYDAMPTIVNSRLPDCATTLTVSPTTYPAFSAEDLSSATSFGPLGNLPCAIVHRAPLNSTATLPNVGGPAPSEPMGFPSLPTMRANA